MQPSRVESRTERVSTPTEDVSHRAVDTEEEISLLDLAITLVENLKLLIFGPLIVAVLTAAYTLTLTPVFVAKATFLPPQQQTSASAALQSLGALAGLAGAAGPKSPADQYVALLTSRTVLDRTIDRFDLMKVYGYEYREHSLRALASSIKTSTGKDGLISVEVEDEDPKRAAALANALVEELGTLLGRLALTEAQQRRVFFEKQLKATRDALTRSQVALQSSGIDTSTLKTQPQAAVTEVAELRARITAQELAIESMRSYLSEGSPDLQRARGDLAALKRQLAKAAVSDTVTGANADYIAKYREYKYHETLFDLFARQFEVAKLDEGRDASTVQVVDPALVPELKSKPKRALIVIMAMAASVVVLLAFVFARMAARARTSNARAAAKLARLKQATLEAVGRRSSQQPPTTPPFKDAP